MTPSDDARNHGETAASATILSGRRAGGDDDTVDSLLASRYLDAIGTD